LDAGRVAREMVEKILDATQQTAGPNGWWGTLTGMAAKTVVGQEFTDPAKSKRSSKGSKVKSR